MIEGVMDEIWEKYLAEVGRLKLAKPTQLRFLLVADDGAGIIDQLVELRNRLKGTGKPADLLLVSRKSELSWESLTKSQIDMALEVDDTLEQNEWPAFERHFERLGVLVSKEVLRSNLANPEINSSFFALVYSSIRGVQTPLGKLITEEFAELGPEAQRVYAFVSLIQSQLLTPWTSLTIRSAGIDAERMGAEM